MEWSRVVDPTCVSLAVGHASRTGSDLEAASYQAAGGNTVGCAPRTCKGPRCSDTVAAGLGKVVDL